MQITDEMVERARAEIASEANGILDPQACDNFARAALTAALGDVPCEKRNDDRRPIVQPQTLDRCGCYWCGSDAHDGVVIANSLFFCQQCSANIAAALGDVEPLESVLGDEWVVIDVDFNRDTRQWTAFVDRLDDQGNFMHVYPDEGKGPTIDAAIRAAVANAKGGK